MAPPAGRGRGQSRGRATAVNPQQTPAQQPPARNIKPGGVAGAGDVTKGMASMRLGAAGPSSGGNGGGNGDNGGNLGRGGVRGKRRLDPEVHFFRTRPEQCESKQGKTGTPIKLIANYFEVIKRTDWIVYQYRVDFSEEQDSIVVKKAWLRQHRERIGTSYIFDGTCLFSCQELTVAGAPLTLTSLKIDETPVRIDIKLVGQLQEGDYTYFQIFNLLLRRAMGKMDLIPVGRNLYDHKAATNIGEYGLSVWPGYITSIRQHENSILLCCDLSHKVMRTDLAYEIIVKAHSSQVADPKKFICESLLGETVLTDYNNRTYRIDDIDFDSSPSTKFKGKNGDISFMEYYKQKYNLTIKDPHQPLLVSRCKEKDIRGGKNENIRLIPELCRMTGLTATMRNQFQLMRALADVTHVSPRDKIRKLLTFNKNLMSSKEVVEDFRGWNLKLSQDLLTLNARLLDPEQIVYGGNIRESCGAMADWTRSSQDKPMLVSAEMHDWVVIVTRNERQNLNRFVKSMIDMAAKMKFFIPLPKVLEIENDRIGVILQAVDRIIAQGTPDMLMFVFSNNSADRYNAVKKRCYIDRAISSQVVLKRNLTHKNSLTIATKIAIQLNCKLGGAPWTVPIPPQDTMVIGFDVCHDKSDRKYNSYGAMVATCNKSMTSWYSSVTRHTNDDELAQSIGTDLVKALHRWRELNNILPARIIFYRDGVGEGQVKQVANVEVESVKATLRKVYGSDDCKLGFIVVNKRINTRFMTQNQSNPQPGTIVDDVVTLPERYDFYLISQAAKQGTVSPTSYSVVSDTTGWSPDIIQRLTHKLTHLYYNLSASVRVPAPCQYAHKLAFLVGQNLHGVPTESLSDRLFFI